MPKNGDSAFLIARSIFESDIWEGDIHLLKLWIYLLGKAKFKKNSLECGELPISLRQIQQDNCYISPKSIIRKYWSRHKVDNMLKQLEEEKRIICKRTSKGTIVKVIKYKDYQNLLNYKRDRLGDSKGTRRGHVGDTSGTPTLEEDNKNQAFNTLKNVKNVKNVKNNTTDQKKKINFDFNKEIWENITDKDREGWRKAYPACNVDIELKQMKEWLLSNPDKRKSRYRRFITNWLSRSQERGGSKGKIKGGQSGKQNRQHYQTDKSRKEDKYKELYET